MKASGELWTLEPAEFGGRILANDARQTVIAKPAGSPFNSAVRQDFESIVAAHNALSGLNPEGVADVIKALQSFVTACDTAPPVRFVEAISDCCKEAEAALSKIKQQPS